MYCSHTWRVPKDLKGQFVAKLKYSTEPFEIDIKETKFTIK